eukprot:6445247-Pyramimonas_sp.AAC.1
MPPFFVYELPTCSSLVKNMLSPTAVANMSCTTKRIARAAHRTDLATSRTPHILHHIDCTA